MPNPSTDDAQNQQIAEQLYDMIMGEIEPDLLLANIPGLDEKYKGESDSEHEARMARYQKAYETFDKKFAEFMTDVHLRAHATKKKARLEQEAQAKTEEDTVLQSIESAIS